MINVCIIFGGKSVEHEISVISANSILNSINHNKYAVNGIYINKNGEITHTDIIKNKSDRLEFKPSKSNKILISVGSENSLLVFNKRKLIKTIRPDVFFPVIHGTSGEDGSIQGLLELMNKPYVGCDVQSSSICIDKIITKKLIKNAGIRTAEFVEISKDDWVNKKTKILNRVKKNIGVPCFVKASNLGSSIGIYKTNKAKDLSKNISKSFKYASTILIEESILDVEEIEVSVLGNESLTISCPGSIAPSSEFYDYNAKYIDGKSLTEIPYSRSLKNKSLGVEIHSMSTKAYKELNCSGMARVDFLYGTTIKRNKPALFLSEINTIPGFTEISMYPKLLEHGGLKLEKVVVTLINLAIKKYNLKKKLVTNFD